MNGNGQSLHLAAASAELTYIEASPISANANNLFMTRFMTAPLIDSPRLLTGGARFRLDIRSHHLFSASQGVGYSFRRRMGLFDAAARAFPFWGSNCQ